MEDKVSHGSVDSLSVTDEFVVVTPTEEQSTESRETGLKIAGNGNMEELQHNLQEVLDEPGTTESDEPASTETDGATNSSSERGSLVYSEVNASSSRQAMQHLEEKVLNEHVDTGSPQTPEGEGPDPWVPRSERHTPSLGPFSVIPIEKTCTMFSGIIYLGSATVNAPKSEGEVVRNMTILKDQESKSAIAIIFSVPRTSEGAVRLLEPDGKSEIAHYRITRILFCCRGQDGSTESDCFAFTCSHGSKETQLFQCHVFRCAEPEAVQRVLACFGQAFHRVPKSPQIVESSMHAPPMTREKILNLTIPVFVDIREDDGKGSFSAVPRDKRCFKLKQGAKKEIIVTVQQTNIRKLNIERCFGLLICPGREVPDREMHLLDVVKLEQSSDGKSFIVTSEWDPNHTELEVLNTESPAGLSKGMFMTIAIDLVMVGIQEPVRFVVEAQVRIFSPNEKFWYFNKKPIQEFFYILLEEEESSVENEYSYKVLSLESQAQRERLHIPLRGPVSSSVRTPDSLNSYAEEESEDDEPLQSGSGNVDKDCAEDILLSWGDILAKWRTNLSVRPKQLKHLVRKGIPEALRGEVWQLLAGVHESQKLMEDYRILITKDSVHEDMIQRDISRTFTAHEKFQSESEGGQEAMFKVSKAYSIYDEEVGYCQGMSFLTAVLWLHMPEEQAFAVFAQLMYEYQMREMYLDNFRALHIKFYQLDRLIEDNLPDLFYHFVHIGIETHMFASQWFLTLFTAKFPLTTVFHIIDVFLSEGMNVVFNVSLAFLKTAKKELLGQDFEGVLKYFRVFLPKRFRTEESAQELIQVAMSTKVSSRKMKKYEKEYYAIKEEEEREDPVSRLERENKELMASNMRLEQENDELAHELITYKLAMEKQLDNERDRLIDYEKELKTLNLNLIDREEENRLLESETSQVKEMYRREMEKAEVETKRNTTIISEYKQICSQLSERLEKQQNHAKDELLLLRSKLQPCDKCSNLVDENGRLVQSVTDSEPSIPQIREPELETALQLTRELELQLAQTKLQLVESQCRAQDLEHELNSVMQELQQSSRHRTDSWISKTLSSFKEAATVKKD